MPKSIQEIEASLAAQADRLRQLAKAAKDQAAQATAEPADLPLRNIGDPSAANPITIEPKR